MNFNCHGWTFLWVGECVLGRTPKGCFSRYFELDCGPKVIPQWLCLYSSKRWQSVLWYNLHKKINGIKDFLVKKQFFLYWIRHRYQSKTCVEHIQQVIDKLLINPINSSMYEKRIRKANQENFNLFGRVYGHVRFNDNGNRF